jgi:hypothetical protein
MSTENDKDFKVDIEDYTSCYSMSTLTMLSVDIERDFHVDIKIVDIKNVDLNNSTHLSCFQSPR